jgi:formyltetrahydrofolate deformylase
MRLECEFNNANWDIESIKTNFNSQIAEKFNMSWEIYTQEYKTKLLHCLNTTIAYNDILGRYSAGELQVETLIISNHVDLRPVADRFGIPFIIFLLPKTKKRANRNK